MTVRTRRSRPSTRAPARVRRFLLDANVVLYATGTAHRYRDPCRHLVALADDGLLRPEASVELAREVLWARARRLGDRAQALQDARDAGALCALHPVEPADLETTLAL